ncbi:MAG: hypothetical protein MUC78_06520 [Bacteroidales bacterium]|nr:hypothetical protein [Bacteroidales bacterium]
MADTEDKARSEEFRAQGSGHRAQSAWNIIVSPPETGGVSLAVASEGVVDNKAIKQWNYILTL